MVSSPTNREQVGCALGIICAEGLDGGHAGPIGAGDEPMVVWMCASVRTITSARDLPEVVNGVGIIDGPGDGLRQETEGRQANLVGAGDKGMVLSGPGSEVPTHHLPGVVDAIGAGRAAVRGGNLNGSPALGSGGSSEDNAGTQNGGENAKTMGFHADFLCLPVDRGAG